MQQHFDMEKSGQDIATKSIDVLVENMEAYCTAEEQMIRLRNEPEILMRKAEFSELLKTERYLEQQMQSAERPGQRSARKYRAVYYWAITVVLTVAGFIFTLLTFAPFRFGAKAWLYCLGVAIVSTFLIERTIQHWCSERLAKWLTTFACVAALLSLITLAVIRGNLFTQQLTQSNAAVVFEDEQSSPPENHFYEKTAPLISLALVLLAFAMEVGSGLALYEAWKEAIDNSEDWIALHRELSKVRARMSQLVQEITSLHHEPASFAAIFWRDFHRAVLTHGARKTMRLLALLITLLTLSHLSIAKERMTLVIAVDLTQSVNSKGPDSKTDFEKNINGVTQILAQVPAGARVTVIGITDQSLAKPFILLSAQIADDPGYFNERLQKARSKLIYRWENQSFNLHPHFRATDILGALALATQLFQQMSDRSHHMLIIFSDMRHKTRELDLESLTVVPSLININRHYDLSLPNLQKTEVHILGANGALRSMAYQHTLQNFWTDYFRATGATLRSYSALRYFNFPER